jgi:two-component system response regulator YesN
VLCTKVLVVDDEVPIRESLRMFPWAKHEYELAGEAKNGREALAICEQVRPEIVLTDIVMPAMDGLQLMEELKRRNPDTQIILLTCHSDFDYVRQALLLGACDYLLKGAYRSDDLLAALNRAKTLLPLKPGVEAERYEIREAYTYIHNNLREPFGLPQVAEHVGLSPNYFGNLFHKETGHYFQDYVKRVRMEHAAYLLRHSALKVYEVAAEVGIPNYRYFFDMFNQHYNISPREYRCGDE